MHHQYSPSGQRPDAVDALDAIDPVDAVDAARLVGHYRQLAGERARRLHILSVVTRGLSRAVTVAEIADVFVDHAITALGAVNGSLYLLDENREHLEMIRQCGYSADTIEPWRRVPLALSIPLCDAVHAAEPVWLASQADFILRYPAMSATVERSGSRAFASVPLVADGRAFGVIGLSFEQERVFDDEEREFAIGLVDQCAHAIERARLYERATEANHARDKFLAVLSHELRTPLAPILPALSALEVEPMSEIGRAMTGIIHRNVLLEARLIDDLLDVARVVNGKLSLLREQVDLHLSIMSVVSICRGDIDMKGIDLELHLDAARTIVDADATRIQQALWNLLKNAVKFTDAGGRIVITTSNDGAGHVVVSIADDGLGIRPEMLTRIFDPFMQGGESVHTVFGGMGLGLAITKAVIDLHGGSLTARSEGKGRGSEFTIVLDASSTSTMRTRPADRVVTELAGDAVYRVLLVDDHEDTSFALKTVLERSGFRVTTAPTCTAARQLAALGEFDVLVSDIGLPDGTGYDLLADIMLVKRVPAIAISGFGTDQDVARARSVGFRTHLTKPVEHTVLVEAIRRVLAG